MYRYPSFIRESAHCKVGRISPDGTEWVTFARLHSEILTEYLKRRHQHSNAEHEYGYAETLPPPPHFHSPWQDQSSAGSSRGTGPQTSPSSAWHSTASRPSHSTSWSGGLSKPNTCRGRGRERDFQVIRHVHIKWSHVHIKWTRKLKGKRNAWISAHLSNRI